MKFRQINRIFFKIFFSWIAVFFVLFLWYEYVNLENQPSKDLLAENRLSKFWDSAEIKANLQQALNELKQKQIKEEKEGFVKRIQETNKVEATERVSEDTKNKFLTNLYENIFSQSHASAFDEKTYKKLCSYYSDYCSILSIDEDFSYHDKVYYSAISIYLLKFLKWSFPNLLDDIYYIKLQKHAHWRRGYAWHHTVIINIKENMQYQEFSQVLTHELGHIVDLWFIEWDRLPKSTQFKEFWHISFYQNDPSLDFYAMSFLSEKVKKPEVYSKDFVSWYWMSDIFEDFAECFNMYVNHNFVFIQMSKESNILKKKYNYINKLMRWKYINSWNIHNYRYWYRPWDTTKLEN